MNCEPQWVLEGTSDTHAFFGAFNHRADYGSQLSFHSWFSYLKLSVGTPAEEAAVLASVNRMQARELPAAQRQALVAAAEAVPGGQVLAVLVEGSEATIFSFEDELRPGTVRARKHLV